MRTIKAKMGSTDSTIEELRDILFDSDEGDSDAWFDYAWAAAEALADAFCIEDVGRVMDIMSTLSDERR
jgi:hypothetical protein